MCATTYPVAKRQASHQSRKPHGRREDNRRESQKMRVLFISAANDAGSMTPLPLGLACVAGATECAGHEMRLLTLGINHLSCNLTFTTF